LNLHDRKFDPIPADEIEAGKAGAESVAAASQVVPTIPPDDAPAPDWMRLFGRARVAHWAYRTENGKPIFFICRIDKGTRDGKRIKEFLPACWFEGKGWASKHWPSPRPLYNLPNIIANPSAPIVVVEGEKAADAAARIFPKSIVTTSSGGALAPKKTDWNPIRGRPVMFCPDDDAPGRRYAQEVADMLTAIDCSVSIVDTAALREAVANDVPADDGWDIADAIIACPDIAALRKAVASVTKPVDPPSASIDDADVAPQHDNEPPGEPAPQPEPEKEGPLVGLVKATADNPGAPFAPEALEALAALKSDDRAAFEELRSQLKRAGARVTALDDAIAGKDGSGGRGPSQADVLLEIAQGADLFHTEDSIGYADIDINGHRETWPIRNKGFRRWLASRFFEQSGGAPNSDALQSALNVIEAKAHFGAPERQVHVRVGGLEGRLYLDLGDETWRAVEIDATGWRVVDNPPVRFRRSSGMKSLPIPVCGGSIATLRSFLNVQSNEDFVLVVAWVLACFRDRGPYPVLALAGENGSAKSTFSAIMRALIDPNTAPLRALPREDRDLFIAATNARVLAFDNVSGLPTWISDTLCRLATGGGFAVRQLYSDQDEVLFNETRPMILNGIEDIVARPDLADRAVILTLEQIPEENRRLEAELWAEFEAARPGILGVLLDAVAKGLAMLPQTRLDKLPRMADFALWATACETTLWPSGTFWSAYCGNRGEAVEGVLDADPLAAAVRAMLTTRTEWTGTASDLLGALGEMAGERVAKSKTWPDSPRALAGRLRRVATFLRKIGINISFEREGRARTRTIVITTPEPDNKGTLPSALSAPSASTAKLNPANGLRTAPLRTVGEDADGAAQGDDPTVRTVRANPLKSNGADGADGADANLPTLSAPENKGWRGRL
jgi:hypothetical protein